MIITRDLIFYFVRKVTLQLPKELRQNIKNAKVYVVDNQMIINPREDKQEALGFYDKNKNQIVFMLSSINNFVAEDNNLFRVLSKVKDVVEHEILHATGLNEAQIEAYQKTSTNSPLVNP